jgi:tetratricopeptide (TPR) repeat protein
MPVRMRGPQGETIDADDARASYYASLGFTPITSEQEYREDVAAAAKPDDRGVLGSINAVATSALSGLTLGGSDVLLGSLSTGNEREQISADRAANPGLSTAANVAGGLAASFAAPGSMLARSPAGMLSNLANEGVAAVRATQTGARAFAGQAAITGAEAAAQNVGQYLGSVALGDRALTAEGLGGALGSGFVLGAAGGAAVYGLEKGSIAARNLFSQVMEGGDDAARAAGSRWETKSAEVFDGNRANLDEAKRQIAEASAAVEQAQIGRLRAGQAIDEERLYAARAGGDGVPGPATVPDAPTPAGLADDVLPPGAATPPPAAVDNLGGFRVSDDAGRALDDVTGGPVLAKAPGGKASGAATDGGFAPRKVSDPGPVEPPRQGPSEPLSGDEFQQYKDAYRDATTNEHYAAGMMYSGGDYQTINAALRRGEVLTGDAARAQAGLDAALDLPQSTLPRDATLYRGLSGKEARERFANVKPGDTFEDLAYTSTAANADSVVRNENIVFNISAPAGTMAAPIPSKYSSEQELLLGRGTKFRVTRSEMVPQVPTASRWTDAVAHEVLPDKSVRITFENGFKHTYPPIREIDVSIVPPVRSGSAARLPANLPAPAQRLASLVSEAEDAESALMRMLMGTKAQIDDGATIGQVGAGARALPASPKQLGDTYDNLVEQAAQATDIGAKQALLRQASEIEDQLATLPKSAKALTDIDSVAQAMGRYEKAMADVAEELGEKASPISREMADGLRKAESGADKAMVDRATQAIDDAAEEGVKQGGLFDAPTRAPGLGAPTAAPDAPIGEAFGPTRLSSKERIAYAKERKIEADVALKGAKVTEAEARAGYKAAQRRADEIGRAADAVSLPTPKGGPEGAGAGRAADIGSALELANMVGIPGLPKPSDLPIIGPVLGLYLKARALKAGADRLMGRVPATGNAKVAALAAKTKDKAARAVDRMLGYVERSSAAQRTVVAVAGPKLLEAMRERIYDDGQKAPDKESGIQEHAAARSREISALVANPALITAQVRKQMRDVADPEMVSAAVQFRTAQLGYLNKVSPKPPPPSPFDKSTWKPPRTEATDFARRYAVAMDPVQALEQVEQRCLTPEAAEAFKAVYPLLFEQTRSRLLDKAPTLQQKLPRSQLTRMSILFDIPLDSALEPATLAMTQAAFATTRPADPTQQQTPPAPSIAGSTNLTALYQTGSDRRAAMR